MIVDLPGAGGLVRNAPEGVPASKFLLKDFHEKFKPIEHHLFR